MNPYNSLSRNTQRYLTDYRRILSDMISQMEAAQLTDSISGSFIRQMLPHHRAAVEMSRNLLRYTTNTALQRIAENIIATQTDSIAALQAAYPRCSRTVNSSGTALTYRREVTEITQRMFERMETARSLPSIDCDFILEMIPHHEGAISMSRLALRYSLCPALISILDEIISSQTRGVRELRELCAALKCT